MKKFLLLLSVGISLVSASQPITDTGTLRANINAEIVTNGTKAITAVKLNRILNGYLNAWPNNLVNATSPLSWNAGTRTMSLPGWNASNWNTVYNWYIGGGYVPPTRKLTIHGLQYDLSQDRRWATPLNYSAQQIFIDTTKNIAIFGDSYLSSFVYHLINYYGSTITMSYATPGRSALASWKNFMIDYTAIKAQDIFLMMQGYNDAARGTNKKGGKEQVANIFKSMVANWFLASEIPANDGGVTYSGTWTTAFPDDSAALKAPYLSGHSKQTFGNAATASYTFSGTSLVIGFATTTGTPRLDSFRVAIDGVDRGWSCFDSTNYGKTDFGEPIINKNTKGVGCLVFRGLATGSHTVVITKGTNTSKRLVIDYFGVLQNPDNAKPAIVTGVPRMPNHAYNVFYGPGFGGILDDDVVDFYNYAIEESLRDFEGFPLSYFNVNEWIRIPNDISSDSVHPNANGGWHIAEGFINRTRKVEFTGTGGGGPTYTAGPGIGITGGNVIYNTDFFKHNYFRNTGTTGDGIYLKINDSTLGFKKLIAGTGVTITPSDSALTIEATGGGGGVSFEAGEVLAKRTVSSVDSAGFDLSPYYATYKRFVIQLDKIQGDGSSAEFRMRVRTAGAGSWLSSADSYKVSLNSSGSIDEDWTGAFFSMSDEFWFDGEVSISKPNASGFKALRGWFGGTNSFGSAGDNRFTAIPQSTTAIDEVIFYTQGSFFGGGFSGQLTLIGYKN